MDIVALLEVLVKEILEAEEKVSLMEIQEEMKNNRKGQYSSLLHNEGVRGASPPCSCNPSINF